MGFSICVKKGQTFTPRILYVVVLICQDQSSFFKGGQHHENVTNNQKFLGVSLEVLSMSDYIEIMINVIKSQLPALDHIFNFMLYLAW